MLPALPFEVWAHIASFLSDVQLETLFSVNQALYEISMDSRHKALQVRYPNRRTVSKLRMIRDTVSVGRRVQDLEVSFRVFDTLRRARSTRSKRLRNQLRRFTGVFSKDSTALTTKSVSGFEKILLESVDKMDGIRSVFFDLHSSNAVEQYLPTAARLWSLLLGRVYSLSVRVCERHAHLLYSTFSSLLGVRHLSVTLQGISDSEAHGLADLINTASQSLESLRFEMFFVSTSSSTHAMFTSLRMYMYRCINDMPSILPFTDVCPRLKRVELSLYNSIGAEMATFLNAHGESIEELDLSFCRPIEGPPFTIAALQLPSLRSLSVAWNLFNWGDENPFQQFWADAYFPALDRLKIISPFMDVDHIAIFCDMFKRSGGAGVRRLELPCRSINAKTFDHLSEAFPNLHALILPTIFLSNLQYSGPSWNIESFAIEMGRREYPNWTLYDLEITPPKSPSFGQPECFPPASYHAMQIAASHIPSIRSFCGSGHMDVPESAKCSVSTCPRRVAPRLLARD